jgi:hypothetical protein
LPVNIILNARFITAKVGKQGYDPIFLVIRG